MFYHKAAKEKPQEAVAETIQKMKLLEMTSHEAYIKH